MILVARALQILTQFFVVTETHEEYRWEPTSQICSCCGYRWGKLDLSIRSVLCLNCGTEHDRDVNAGKNIEAAGLCRPEWANAKQCKTSLEAVACLPTHQEAV